MGNCLCITLHQQGEDHVKNASHAHFKLFDKSTLYEWTDEIEVTFKQLLRNNYNIPQQIVLIILSYIDKEYKIFDPTSTIKYPMYIPTDLLTYPVKHHLTSPENLNTTVTQRIYSDEPRFDCRIMLHGSVQVGKTAIAFKFVTNTFLQDYDRAVEDQFRKKMMIDDKIVSLQIMDPDRPRQEDFVKYVRNSDVHLIVFAINNEASFREVEKSFRRIVGIIDTEHPLRIILVGSKGDLKDDKYSTCVGLKKVVEYAKRRKIPFVQTSAQDWGNICLLFEMAVRYYFRCKDLKTYALKKEIK